MDTFTFADPAWLWLLLLLPLPPLPLLLPPSLAPLLLTSTPLPW